MSSAPPLDELLAFWREVDRGATGEASAEQFDNAVYRLQARTSRLMLLSMGFPSILLGGCPNTWRVPETRGTLRARMTLPRIVMISFPNLVNEA